MAKQKIKFFKDFAFVITKTYRFLKKFRNKFILGIFFILVIELLNLFNPGISNLKFFIRALSFIYSSSIIGNRNKTSSISKSILDFIISCSLILGVLISIIFSLNIYHRYLQKISNVLGRNRPNTTKYALKRPKRP